ncbi:MAG: beta-lactamase family protein, partial [bacterium]|nr:beta-lactamase family protein [bacterium]
MSAARLKRADTLIERHVTEKKLAGAAELEAGRGKVAHFRAYGQADVEAGQPMRKDAIFRIASMTKPITSVAVMMLYEDGHFLLTDPLSKHLPEFEKMTVLTEDGAPEPAKRPITIRHLLTHTSGLTYQWNKRLGQQLKDTGITHGLLEDDKTLAQGMKSLAGIPLLFQPGEKFEYGLSIDVLGRLVEVASGKTLDVFFREEIF